MIAKVHAINSNDRLRKLSDPGALRLCYAILKQAARDYRVVMRYGDQASFNRYELEKFFKSTFFDNMLGSATTPQDFMKRAREYVEKDDDSRMEVVRW